MAKPYVAGIVAIVAIYIIVLSSPVMEGAVPLKGTVTIKNGAYVGQVSPQTRLYLKGWDIQIYEGRARFEDENAPMWQEVNYPLLGDRDIIIEDLERLHAASRRT